MFRKRSVVSARSTRFEKRHTWNGGIDDYIGESYAAIEKTNFYDAVYSPVILFLNAVVVAAVMLFAASGNKRVLTLFGMSVGTSVAVINYISQIILTDRESRHGDPDDPVGGCRCLPDQ